MSGLPSRRGFTLVELLVSLLLGGLIVGSAWAAVARQRAVVTDLVERADWLSSVRMAREVVGRDVASAVGPPAFGRDTVGLRVVRGWALDCALDVGGDTTVLTVRYRGIRVPDAGKDSLRLLHRDGRFQVAELVETWREPACDGQEGRGYRLRADRAVGRPGYVEVFERGSYHMQGHALRYRSPGGTRQPLTPENVDTPSGFSPAGRSMWLVPRPSGDAWRIPLGMWRR